MSRTSTPPENPNLFVFAMYEEAAQIILNEGYVELEENLFRNNKNNYILITGVGKINVVYHLTLFLIKHKVSRVINLGTSGTLNSGIYHIDTIHKIGSVKQFDFKLPFKHDYNEDILIGDGVRLLTGDSFINSSFINDENLELGLVDMEGYGVAYTCKKFSIPVEIYKYISDDCCSVKFSNNLDKSSMGLHVFYREQFR